MRRKCYVLIIVIRKQKRNIMKPATRKAMTVATVFTGAATAVAVFTPAAHAGAENANTVTHRPQHRSGKVRPLDQWGKQTGSIKEYSCSAGLAEWLHIGMLHGIVDSKYTLCFGYHGLFDVSSYPFGAPATVDGQCGGNNRGVLNPKTGGTLPFAQGTTYRSIGNNGGLNSISIAGWAGTDKCASVDPY
jgi:hypothetical protein